MRSVSDAVLGQAASLLAGEGSVYHVGANPVEGPEALTLVTLGQRWPAQIEPGWTAPVLALSGLEAISMRARPPSRAEAMSFLTVRLRQVRAAERLAHERGELSDVERERVLQTSASGRRTVHAGGRSRLPRRHHPPGARSGSSVAGRAPRHPPARDAEPRIRARSRHISYRRRLAQRPPRRDPIAHRRAEPR